MRVDARDVAKVFPTPDGPLFAVAGLDLTVAAGTSMSIIGPNGAGKSTVLRLISGIVPPTSGTIRRAQRCASLIELGAGFHPDLTGRENLLLGMALAGLSVRRRAQELATAIDFTGLGDAIDLPMKHMSTGMIGRVGCAAALHTQPDLLLIDEVLAVGDAEFQRVMLRNVAALTAEGTALILVTHSPELAAMATTRTMWLDRGSVVADGPTPEILTRYEAAVRGWGRSFTPNPVTIAGVHLQPSQIRPGESLQVSIDLDVGATAGPVELRIEFRPTIGDEPWMRSNEDSLETWQLNLIASTAPVRIEPLAPGQHRVDVEIGAVPISPSEVELSVLLADDRQLIIDETLLTVHLGEASLRPVYHLVASMTPAPGER